MLCQLYVITSNKNKLEINQTNFVFQVRKTSVRMTAIKEYPFDLSDLQNQLSVGAEKPAPPQAQPPAPVTNARPSATTLDGKRKVSIMADESSKDRENLPSDRERYVY